MYNVEYGDYNVTVSEDGKVTVFKNDGVVTEQIDAREDFALMMLTNTLPLDKVVAILEAGWGKLGCLKENEDSNIGFFGPIL